MASVDNLKIKATSAVIWNFTELMLRRGAGGLTTLVLAWFLTPEDFGLVAMMAVFLSLSNVLVDAGFSQALIRKQSVSSRDYNTAFYSNIAFAVIAYAGLFLAAPAIASFYEESRLVSLVRVAGLAVIFTALSAVQLAVLSRELKFRLQLQVSLPAALISGLIAILLAYLEAGVWALVGQILVQAMVTAILYWGLAIWRPSFSFGWAEFKTLFSFGGYLLLNQVTTVPFKYMYVIVIAKLFSSQLAGLFFFSQKIRDLLVEQLVSSVQTVTFPALATLQDDPKRLKNGYRQVIATTTFLVFPGLIFLVALAENLFHLFLPESWWEATIYVQLLCIAALMNPLNAINLNILKVTGRSDLVFYLGLFKKALAIGIFAVSFRYGVMAIIMGQIVHSVLAYLPNSHYSKRLIHYSVSEQLADILPGLMLAGSIGVLIWWLQSISDMHEITELAIFGCGAVVAYIIGAWILKLQAFDLAAELIKAKLKVKAS